ncbi:type II toxin-antitoxin system HicB family antitoxin [Raineya sp.]|jgi:predicted RNase H-like HicB family nuclease
MNAKYLVIFEKNPNGGYGAYVPDLPGCAAVGETYTEVAELIEEAIKFHIEGLLEEGLEIPEPTSIEIKLVEI